MTKQVDLLLVTNSFVWYWRSIFLGKYIASWVLVTKHVGLLLVNSSVWYWRSIFLGNVVYFVGGQWLVNCYFVGKIVLNPIKGPQHKHFHNPCCVFILLFRYVLMVWWVLMRCTIPYTFLLYVIIIIIVIIQDLYSANSLHSTLQYKRETIQL